MNARLEKCRNCNGNGYIVIQDSTASVTAGSYLWVNPCPKCSGTGIRMKIEKDFRKGEKNYGN